MSKERLNVCFIGHVDSGKSTTVGNLAYQMGCIDQRKMDKLKKEAEDKGKGTFSYAFVTDRNEAERDRGITITTTLIKIETGKYALNVIDCPGHKDFIKNMVTGTSQADCAVVMVPCAKGEFESSISGGTLKEHIMISGILGVPKLIFCVNKMDTVPEKDQPGRFKEVHDEMKLIASKIHPDKDPIIIPISGYQGINIIEKGKKFEWFKGWSAKSGEGATVFTLEGALNYQTPPPRPNDKPLRMLINDSINVKGIGTVLTGQVISGVLTPGQMVLIQPSGIVGEVKTLEIHKNAVEKAESGENCGFVIKVTSGCLDHVKSGHVLSSSNKDQCIKLSYGAKATILIVNHPKGIKPGYTPVMDCGTSHVPVSFASFVKKSSKKSKEPILNPDIVFKGESANTILIPKKPCIMEPRVVTPQLGRLAIRDGGKIVGIGAVEEIYSLEQIEAMGLADKGKEAAIKTKTKLRQRGS